jgi:hypothetical protein
MNSYAYIKLLTAEYPRFQGDIRLEHPEIGDVFVCPDTYGEVYEPEVAVVPGANERAVEGQPIQINGKWVRQFTLIPRVDDLLPRFPKFINGTRTQFVAPEG